MADITMCIGADCPLKHTCYRYTAEPSPLHQSVADYRTALVVDGCELAEVKAHCREFLPLRRASA